MAILACRAQRPDLIERTDAVPGLENGHPLSRDELERPNEAMPKMRRVKLLNRRKCRRSSGVTACPKGGSVSTFIALLAAVFAVLAAAATTGRETAGQVAPRQQPLDVKPPAGIDLEALVAAHNRVRAESKLPPLRANTQLGEAARDHARDMAEHGKLSHEGSDGSDTKTRVKRRGYRYQEIGENVAEGQSSIEEVMRTWMNSPLHRENILGNFTEIGAAVAPDAGNRRYWCVDLGRPWPKVDPSKDPIELIAAMNRARAIAKKSQVKEDPKLARVAAEFVRDLAARRKVDTKNRDGQTPFDILRRQRYQARQFAMSLASGESDPAAVVRSWLERKEERVDLLSSFNQVGAAVAADEDGIPYWVLLMAQTSPR